MVSLELINKLLVSVFACPSISRSVSQQSVHPSISQSFSVTVHSLDTVSFTQCQFQVFFTEWDFAFYHFYLVKTTATLKT